MKIQCNITLSIDNCYQDKQYDCLIQLNPTAQKNTLWESTLPLEDSRHLAIMDLLKSYGMRPVLYRGLGRKKGEYWLHYQRIYNEHDYTEAPLLVPSPVVYAGWTAQRTAEGLLEIEADDLRKTISLASAGGLLISENLRRMIQQSNLQHVLHKPIKVLGARRAKYEEKYWELFADYQMPPLSDTCRFSDGLGNGVQDRRLGVLDEAPYQPAEYHYRQSDINGLEAFDLAITHEIFGGKRPWFVASKTFYAFCVDHGIPMNWIPVRIDPD